MAERLSLFCVCVIPACHQTVQETDWTVFSASPLCKWLPGGLSSPATPKWDLQQDYGAPLWPQRLCLVRFLSLRKQKTRKKKLTATAPYTSPSTYPSTDGTKNNGLFSCASAPLRALWLGSAAGLRFQPHVLHSNQKSQAWQYGYIAGGDTQRKSTSREGGEGRSWGEGVWRRGGENKPRWCKEQTVDEAGREEMWRQ